MAEAGDLIQEFKQAKPPEKTVIILGALAVVGIGGYLYIKNKAAGASTAGVMPAAGATGGSSGGQVAGYPSVGAAGTPVLPGGVNPVYDPNGNLVAFQNPSGTPTTTTPAPTANPFTWPSALTGMKIWKGTRTGTYFYGMNGPQKGYANQTPLATLFPTGTTFSGSTGSSLTYTLPGAAGASTAPVTLANPLPPKLIASNTHLAKTAKKGP